jgi:type II secretion system protein G
MRYSLGSLVLFTAAVPPLLAGAVWAASAVCGAGVSRCSSRDAARTQATLLSDAVNHYRIETGELPRDLESLLVLPPELTNPTKWHGLYLDKHRLPEDPWGNKFEYQALIQSTGKFRVWSRGPDGISGTRDDIFGD